MFIPYYVAIVDGNDKDFKSDRLMEEENISAIIMNNADADMGFNPSLIKSNNDEKVLVGKDEVIQIGPAEDLYVFESDHEDQEDELEKYILYIYILLEVKNNQEMKKWN